MKRPLAVEWRIAGALLAAMTVVYAWSSLRHGGESRYKGQSVEYWFLEYCRYSPNVTLSSGERKEALAALFKLRSNAVPYLVRIAFTPDSKAKEKYNRMHNNFCKLLDMDAIPDWQSKESAVLGALKELKAPASIVLPLIEHHLTSTNQFERMEALSIMATMGDGGERAVPQLTNELRGLPRMCSDALRDLRWLGPRAAPAVPLIADFLECGSNNLQTSAIWTLGAIGTNAIGTVPTMERLFANPLNADKRWELAINLCRIDPSNTVAIAYLTNLLYGSSSIQFAAISALGYIGPNASWAAPKLLDLIETNHSSYLYTLPRTAQLIGVPGNLIAARLKKRFKPEISFVVTASTQFSGEMQEQYDLAFRVLECDPGDHDALTAVMKMLRGGHPAYRLSAINNLGWAGPPAAEAIPLLREIQKSGSRRERAAARKALRSIEEPNE